MNPTMYAQDLVKNFSGQHALDNLNLSVKEGTIFGLLGPNGAGKTTTIKIFLGLLKPTLGYSQILNHDSWQEGNWVRKNSSVLWDESGLYPWLSGPANVLLFAGLYGHSSRTTPKKIEELNLIFNFGPESLGKPIRKLSRGNCQKWALCRALIHEEAKVLFLDEPTVHLDIASAKAVRSHIKTLVEKKGVTVFLSTHNITEALELCDEVAVIHKGRIVHSGPPGDMVSANQDYAILFEGDALPQSEMADWAEKISENASGKIMMRHASRSEVAVLVERLANGGRRIYEVKPCSHALEEILSGLTKE